MATFAFDTLEAQQSLTDAGVEDRHATAFVDLASKSVSENVATKEDIAELKAEMKAELKMDIANWKAELKMDIANRKIEIAELKGELKTGFANRKVEIANQNVHMMYGLLAATGTMIVAVIFL